MQEEVTQKTIALSMKTGKLTAQALQAALKKYLQHRAKGPKLHHGKQSLKQLKAHGAALTNIEVTEANIGAFKPCAKKYGVDFTLRKDKTTQPPHYIVIFKAKDQKLGKALMSEDEIAIMDGGRCILQLRGVRPFFSEKFDITKHPHYKYLADADKKNTFDVDRFLSTLRRKRQQVVAQDEPFDLYEIDLSDEDAAAE